MNRRYAEWHYSSSIIEDTNEGYIGISLHRGNKSKNELAAKIIYWDAAGDFSLEIPVSELPLPIIEDLIREARELVKVR